MDREKRSSNRKLVMKPIEYFLVPSIIGKTFDGLITDISDSGLCLLTTSQLKDRQRIIIEDKSFSSEKVAIVRWSEKYDDMFYKIGLEFTEDQSFLNIKGKRRDKRLNIKNLNISGKMALANYIKIIDISLDGLSFETDKKLNIGKEYILHLQYEGKTWSIKGSIAWSTLKKNERNNKRESIPIYRVGMKLTISSDEMLELIKFIKLRKKRDEKQEYFSLGLDELNIRGKDRKDLESSLHSF
jgi:PilZ domain-containing protein